MTDEQESQEFEEEELEEEDAEELPPREMMSILDPSGAPTGGLSPPLPDDTAV